MTPFTFLTPRGLDEAVAMLGEHGPDARVIAGGQSLLLAMKDRTARPTALVSVAGVPGLRDWTYTGSGELDVGAATTYAELSGAALRGWHAEVAAVAGNLADRPVRTRGTVGGALCQADPRFDMPALAVGVGAQVDTVSADGVRTRPADELFRPEGGTALEPGEILTRVRFPGVDAYRAVAFEKFRYRQFDAALVSVVCAVRPDGARRLTVGAVGPRPVVVSATEPDAVADEILPAAGATTRLRAYQRELVAVLARRAVDRATAATDTVRS